MADPPPHPGRPGAQQRLPSLEATAHVRRGICPCPRLFWKRRRSGQASQVNSWNWALASKSDAKQAVLTTVRGKDRGCRLTGPEVTRLGQGQSFHLSPSSPRPGTRAWPPANASYRPPGWPRMALGKRAAGWEPEGPQCPPDLGWLPAGAAGSVTWQWGDRRKVSHRSQMAASTPRCPKPARDLGSRGGVDGT